MSQTEPRPAPDGHSSFEGLGSSLITRSCGEADTDSEVITPSADWSLEVARYIGMLEEMIHTSEEGFLSIGSKLMEIHAGTRQISMKLSTTLNEYSAEKGMNSLIELRNISNRAAEQLDSFREYSLETIDSLQKLESPLESLPDSIHEFDRLISRLKKMGIVAHIEAARVGDGGLDFVRLAENVSLLGEQIAAKAKEVRAYVGEVDGIISQNKTEMEEMISKHTYVARNVGSDMEANLRVLEEKQEMYRQATSAISIRSGQAIDQINAVVQSVQYHDITRQQVEHIIEALRSIGTSESLVEVIPICEVQVAQLRRVGAEFGAAVLAIVSALENLSGALGMMLSESEHLASFTKESGSTFFQHVERGFETVSATMIEDRSAVKEFASSLRNINENIHKMKSFMDEMADVGLEIELLALNSRVKAAKIGDGGETLGVIAESIQNLSTDTLEQVSEVIGRMSHMVSVAGAIAADDVINNVVNRAEAGTDDIVGKLTEVVALFHSNNTSSTEAFLETERASAVIVNQLKNLSEELKGNGELASFLISTADMLEQLKEKLRECVPQAARADIDARLAEIRDSYTMESERATHTAVLKGAQHGSSESSGGGEIELF